MLSVIPLKQRCKSAPLFTVTVIVLVAMVIGGWYVIVRHYMAMRIKGEFEFKVDDPQVTLTEDEAVKYAQMSIISAGFNVNSMQLCEDPISHRRMVHNDPKNVNSGEVVFRGAPPQYLEYIVEVKKANGVVTTTVVIGK